MKTVNRICTFLFTTSIGLGAGLLCNTPVMADTTLFFDDFNGPTLNTTWQASLTNANLAQPQGGAATPATYQGAPKYGFQTLGGSSVLRLTNRLNNLQRVGWSTSTTFTPSAFAYEVRFNTLIQTNTTSIDSFIELWVFDPNNQKRYDIVSLYGASYSTDKRFAVGSSIDNSYSSQSFDYQNNTWYRLVIQDQVGQNIRISLNNDAGTELIGKTLSHAEGAYSSGFKLALSQAMGYPLSTYPSDVAVDYVSLTAVPEPGSLVLTALGLAGVLAAGRRRLARKA